MQITASGLQPQNNAASGIITDLTPELHTAIVAGKRETTGVGLVKVYRL
jgi:nitrogen-specific signal transduction histidine kinase